MFFFVMLTAFLVGPPKASDTLGVAGAWRVTTLELDPAHRNVSASYVLTLDPVATTAGANAAGYAVRVAVTPGAKGAGGAAPGSAKLDLDAVMDGDVQVAAQGSFDVTLGAGDAKDSLHFEVVFSRPTAKSPWTLDGYFEHMPGPVYVSPLERPAPKDGVIDPGLWGVFKGARGEGKPLALTRREKLSCIACCQAFSRCGGQGPGSCNGSNMCFGDCLASNAGDAPSKVGPRACIDEHLNEH